MSKLRLNRTIGFAVVATISQSWAALAQDNAREIERICETGKAPAYDAEIDTLIRENINWFENADLAKRDPDEAVAKYEEIIARTSYAWILQCPSRVRATGAAYEIRFDAKNSWNVRYGSGVLSKVTMSIMNSRRYVSALFTYLHEMIHVCQRAKGLELQVGSFGNGQSKDQRPHIAHDLTSTSSALSEIEAFYSMNAAYFELA